MLTKETLINSAVRGEVLSLAKGRTMNTEFNKISMYVRYYILRLRFLRQAQDERN